MEQVSSSLTQSYPTPKQLDILQAIFNNIKLGTVLEVRELAAHLLSRIIEVGDTERLVRPSIPQVMILGAAAVQQSTFSEFTQPLTVVLTKLPSGTVGRNFDLLVEREIFVLDSYTRAAPMPDVNPTGGTLGSRIYYPTHTGESLLELFSKDM